VHAVTGAPVGEGFVVLLDEQGREVARGLSSPVGQMRLLDADGRPMAE
jgi:hypothetical protein